MARRNIEFVQGGFYHFYNRGSRKSNIFLSEENFRYCVRLLRKYSHELNISLVAYCLMPNHYHLLVFQNSEKIAGLLPQLVFNSYTKAFNKMYGTSGTLFEGSYKSIQVFKQDYLLQVCEYIHANPVISGLVDSPEKWSFSNYSEWIAGNLPEGTLKSIVTELIDAPEQYAQLVSDYLINRKENKAFIEDLM